MGRLTISFSRVISLKDFFQIRPGLPVGRDDIATPHMYVARTGGVMGVACEDPCDGFLYEMFVVLVCAHACTAPVVWGEISHE